MRRPCEGQSGLRDIAINSQWESASEVPLSGGRLRSGPGTTATRGLTHGMSPSRRWLSRSLWPTWGAKWTWAAGPRRTASGTKRSSRYAACCRSDLLDSCASNAMSLAICCPQLETRLPVLSPWRPWRRPRWRHRQAAEWRAPSQPPEYGTFRGRTHPPLTGIPIVEPCSLVSSLQCSTNGRGLPQPKPLSGIRSEEEDESEVHREAERNLHNRVGVPHGRYP